MPRETIFTAMREGADASGPAPLQVSIGWPKGAVGFNDFVQVGIGTHDGSSLISRLLHDEESLRRLGIAAHEYAGLAEKISAIGAAQTDAEERVHARVAGQALLDIINEVAGSYDSVWADLDRPGANRLIMLIRKARSYVFGKDE